MGVLAYIKHMEIPKDCYECGSEFAAAIRCNHWMEGTYQGKGRPKRCPLVEIEDGKRTADETVKQAITVRRRAIE